MEGQSHGTIGFLTPSLILQDLLFIIPTTILFAYGLGKGIRNPAIISFVSSFMIILIFGVFVPQAIWLYGSYGGDDLLVAAANNLTYSGLFIIPVITAFPTRLFSAAPSNVQTIKRT